MATAQVLLMDDDPRMEALLLGAVRLPPSLLVRDPAGIFEPDPLKHGLVLLNAEFQKSFGLCRRFKKKRETAGVPIAFFTFSHDREHLRILAEHRALPTHADHYLLPPTTAERVLDLLTKTIGAFEAALPAEPPTPREPDADELPPDLEAGDDDAPSFDREEAHEPTREDTEAPAATPELVAERALPSGDDDEFSYEAPDSGDDDDVPPPPPEGMLEPLAADPSIGQGEPSLGGFRTDRLTSVERYVSGLHDEIARREDQIEARRAELDREEAQLRAESAAAVIEAQRKASALAEEAARLRDELQAALSAHGDAAELERVQAEVATLRAELEWARAEAEQNQTELKRLRAEGERVLAESDRVRGESERLRADAERLRAELAEATKRAALTTALEARLNRSVQRTAALGQALLAARPSLVTLLEFSRDLELERQVDADGVPTGLDDR
jgi:hypothetical protein